MRIELTIYCLQGSCITVVLRQHRAAEGNRTPTRLLTEKVLRHPDARARKLPAPQAPKATATRAVDLAGIEPANLLTASQTLSQLSYRPICG